MLTDEQAREKAQEHLQIATDPIEKLRYKLLLRGIAGIKEFAKCVMQIFGFLDESFRLNDDTSDKKVTLEELSQLLESYDVAMPTEELEQIFGKLDPEGSGSIALDEFLGAVRVSRLVNEVRGNEMNKKVGLAPTRVGGNGISLALSHNSLPPWEMVANGIAWLYSSIDRLFCKN